MKMRSLNPALGVGLAVGFVFIASLQSCADLNSLVRSKPGRVLVCGGGGAVTGAAVYVVCDALVDKSKRKACIAVAAVSAIADGINCWWQLSRKIVDDYEHTRKVLNYDLSQGSIVKILEFDADKSVVHPGEDINIRVKYALMSDYKFDEIKVQETFTYFGNNKPRIEVVTRQPGTWGADEPRPVKIDASMPDGKYELMLELKLVDRHSGQDHDRRVICFNVTRAGTPPPAQSCRQSGASANSGNLGVFTLKQNAAVFNKPGGKKTLVSVRRGEVFTIIESRKQSQGLWYKIRLEEGKEGWLPAESGTLQN